ncbi:MAG: low molecular weight phosphotyrosine protein phosphatase [Betaproteobacteria bacterium]|nr:low molecular weight phosphotyrosine protein phosphatase [Betaproteobacteria bacterium]
MHKVLFVCLGNICRSPTAEGVFRAQVAAAGLSEVIGIDSAGTAAWHIGKAPDQRAQAAATRRGYDLTALRGRQVAVADFGEFDYILAMDRSNLADLLAQCPAEQRHKVRLFLSFSSQWQDHEVPDPYYGGADGFDQVLDMVEDAAHGLLSDIRAEIKRRA